MIAVAGIPGSGKTTLAKKVVEGLNARHHQTANLATPADEGVAQAVPLDGYHLTRAQLAAMPDPKEAAYRRGAPFTFDGEKYLRLVQRVRERILPETATIRAPSFDHAIKDPVEDDIAIPPTAMIVVFEGLYVALDDGAWCSAAELMDMLWFVDVSVEVAIERLVKRHVASGIALDAESARRRVLESDMDNGRYILEHRMPVQEMIPSIEDDDWRPKDVPNEVQGLSGDQVRKGLDDRSGSLMALAVEGGGC